MTKVVNIIQARMGSFRFPSKMVANLHDFPIIDWVLKRSLKAGNVDETFLATSMLSRDDVLAERAGTLGVSVYRGSENDVLSRYAAVTKQSNADVVVRVCGDRPLVDPKLIDMAIEYFIANDEVDLVYNHISGEGENWPRGFGAEVFSAQKIIEMDASIGKGYYREHVTPYIWENQHKYTVKVVPCPDELNYSTPDVKCDLDTKEDLKLISEISEGLGIEATAIEYFAAWKRKVRV